MLSSTSIRSSFSSGPLRCSFPQSSFLGLHLALLLSAWSCAHTVEPAVQGVMAAILPSADQCYEILASCTQHLHLSAPGTPPTQSICAVLIFFPISPAAFPVVRDRWCHPVTPVRTRESSPWPTSISPVHLTHTSYSFPAV